MNSLLILPNFTSKYCDSRHMPPHLVYVVPKVKPWVPCMLGKHHLGYILSLFDGTF